MAAKTGSPCMDKFLAELEELEKKWNANEILEENYFQQQLRLNIDYWRCRGGDPELRKLTEIYNNFVNNS